MNSGATAERVYDTLRQRIMGHGFRPGARLDPAALAETLSSSVTPVRDALHLLTGEGLVTTRTGDGFHLPAIDEPGLVDLYAWTAEVLGLALGGWPRGGTRLPSPTPAGEHDDVAARTAMLFRQIASRSANVEHQQAIASLNARLHAVRTVEPHLLDGSSDELDAIEAGLSAGVARDLRRLVVAYHRRRRRHAAEIVRAVYRVA
jgi:DNA-binding FadR family transcriptional regulator